MWQDSCVYVEYLHLSAPGLQRVARYHMPGGVSLLLTVIDGGRTLTSLPEMIMCAMK